MKPLSAAACSACLSMPTDLPVQRRINHSINGIDTGGFWIIIRRKQFKNFS